MKPHEHFFHLLDDLYVDNWSVRSNAQAQLKMVDDPEVIHGLFKEIEKRNDENLRFHFLILLEHYLHSNKYLNCGVSLSCLVLWKGRGDNTLSNKAARLIQDFIHSPKVFRYLKIKSVRVAWKRLPRSKKEMLLSVISENYLKELSGMILTLFNSRNDDVVIEVINTLIRFKDKRGNRYVKKILARDNVSPELICVSLKSIGVLGNFYDFLTVQRFLEHSNPKIQISAITAYSRLLGVFSIPKMAHVFDISNTKVKLEILSRLGKINHKKSVKLLTHYLLEDFSGDLALHVEWALHDIDNKFKVPYLIDEFFNSDDTSKIKILNFFTDVLDHRIEDFILKVMNGPHNDVIKMLTLNLASSCPAESVISLLEDETRKYNGLMSYTALLELYDINGLNNNDILADFLLKDIPLNDLCHQVILKKLADSWGNKCDDSLVENYLFHILKSSRLDLMNMAIEAIVNIPTNKLVTQISTLVKETKFQSLNDRVKISMVKIVLKHPEFVEQSSFLFDDDLFLRSLNEAQMSTEFVTSLSQFFVTQEHPSFHKCKHMLSFKLIKNREKYFTESNDINSLFGLWMIFNLPLGDTVIEFGIKTFYNDLDKSNQKLFIEHLALDPNVKFIDFFYREVIKNSETMGHLVNTFITSEHRGLNE